MSIRDKYHPTDDFWDEKAQERRTINRLNSEINNIKSAVMMGEKILALRGNAGWQDFVKAIEDMRAYRRQELELSSEKDSDLRILQGRCRELGAILSLMIQTKENTQALAGRLKSLVTERDAFVQTDGKLKPKGAHL